ncbi:hypothetical protein MTO96_049092 [Rhipicephalus appendiculatus]
METLGEQAARSSGGQSPKVHTFDVQFPLKKTRLSADRHTLPAHETAPLIKSSAKRSSRLEQFRQAVAKAQSRSSTGLHPTGDAMGDAVEEQELRRGWAWKERRRASPPVQASRRSCHSSDIPDSQEPERTVVQANEGSLHEAWGPLAFRESFLYPLALSLGVVLALKLPTCTSDSCLQNAMYLDGLLSWDNVDPCDDFYAFVCRRWKSQFPAPSADYSVSSDDDYTAFLEERLRDMLRNASQTTRSLQPLQDLYGKCMDVKRTEDEGWNSLLELMFNVSLEGFPLTPPVRRSISVWKAAAKVLRKTGSCALLSAGVGSHPWALKDVVSVGAPDLLTAKGGLDINEAVRLYTMAAFSATRTLKKDFLPPSLALSVVKFATEIEKLAELTLEKSRPVPYVLGSVPEVMDFVAEVFVGVKEAPSYEADSDVLITSPALVSKMLEIVKGAETHTVMNYLGVRLMIETSPFIPHSDLTDVYGALLYGKRRNALPRWQLCIRVVEKALFPLVYFSLFTDLKLHVSVRRFVDLTREIIAEFVRGINASSYFGNVSKAAIRNVISNTRVHVLGPDWLTDPALIDSFADKTPLITGSRRALESYVATYEYTFLDALKRGSAQRWAHPAFSAECWYEHSTRTIYVPILVFNVTHAFDHTIDALQLSRAAPRLHRCVFDALLSEADSTNISDYWLTEGTRVKLQELESCFDVVAHKAQPSFGRLRDSLAARLAYAHFQRSVKTSDRVLALRLQRGHVLNEARLFFVYLMLQTCESSGRLDTPSTAPAGQQWIVALRNGEDFANAYNCSLGTAMNPSSKCISVCRAPAWCTGTRSEEDRSFTSPEARCRCDRMAWNPTALIDPVKKKDDQNADKPKPAASNSAAPAPNAGTSPSGGAAAAQPPPMPEVVESPEVFGSRVPPPPGGGSTWDPTKQPRRPSIAVFKPDAVDDALQGFKAKKQQRRVHFDVTPGELGMNPPSIAWFVCLTFTMFSLTLAVLFIAYYVNRPGSYIPPVANKTKPVPAPKNETVKHQARIEARLPEDYRTDETVDIDVLYKLK